VGQSSRNTGRRQSDVLGAWFGGERVEYSRKEYGARRGVTEETGRVQKTTLARWFLSAGFSLAQSGRGNDCLQGGEGRIQGTDSQRS